MSNQFNTVPMSEQARDLLNGFVSAGWNVGTPAIDRGVPWYAWREIAIGAHKDCSGERIQICAEIHELQLPERVLRAVEFDIRGSTGDFTLDLRAISISFEDAVEASPRVASILVAAWNAAMNTANLPDPFKFF